jgi:hypothetical protein
MNIKRTISVGSLLVFAVALAWAAPLFAQGRGYGMGPGMMGQGQGSGYGMGPGMMGQGYEQQGYGPQNQQPQKPITKSDAESMLKNYISRNPNLKLGTVQDQGDSFEAEVTTKEGSPVNKLFVNKDTGSIRSQY